MGIRVLYKNKDINLVPSWAKAIFFSKKNTGLASTNVQDAIEEVNTKVPFSFGVDSNGQYGYIKDGADTVTPFLGGKIVDFKLRGWGASTSQGNTAWGSITTLTGGSINWTASAANQYLTFTSSKTTIRNLYLFDASQNNGTMTLTVTGATVENLVTLNNVASQGAHLWKMDLTNISGTVKLNVYSTYSAIHAMGYFIME